MSCAVGIIICCSMACFHISILCCLVYFFSVRVCASVSIVGLRYSNIIAVVRECVETCVDTHYPENQQVQQQPTKTNKPLMSFPDVSVGLGNACSEGNFIWETCQS